MTDKPLSRLELVAQPCAERNYQGRPISTDQPFGYWTAIFSDEYDGAPDSHHPVGMGKTEEEAIADLIEQDVNAAEEAPNAI